MYVLESWKIFGFWFLGELNRALTEDKIYGALLYVPL